MTRQTLTFLRKRFEEVGIEPQKKLGQNFLIDLNLIDVLFDAAQIEPTDVVLEVGTGTGSLTARMAPAAAQVITVELDPAMHALASEELEKHDNVLMLHHDILKNKNRLNPLVTEAIDEAVAAEPGRVYKLAANLP
ncbi:MAG: rRNA adenine N-6-methyltransferase family protein, partial [Planctomycetia bacterium]